MLPGVSLNTTVRRTVGTDLTGDGALPSSPPAKVMATWGLSRGDITEGGSSLAGREGYAGPEVEEWGVSRWQGMAWTVSPRPGRPGVSYGDPRGLGRDGNDQGTRTVCPPDLPAAGPGLVGPHLEARVQHVLL